MNVEVTESYGISPVNMAARSYLRVWWAFEENSSEKIPLTTWSYTHRFDIPFLMEVKTRIALFKTGISLKTLFGLNVKILFHRLWITI